VALSLTGGEREAFLDSACGVDLSLRQTLERRIHQAQSSDSAALTTSARHPHLSRHRDRHRISPGAGGGVDSGPALRLQAIAVLLMVDGDDGLLSEARGLV
jgi:hypothetical protein